MRRRRRPTSVLLDSNVWRYIVEDGHVPDLLKQVRRHRLEVQVAPAVVYEALRTRDLELRHRLAEAMTLRCWRRLMPEAYEEAREVLGELRRLRPEWINAQSEPEWVQRLRLDWSRPSGGWWDRASRDTAAEADRIIGVEGDTLERARAQADAARDAARDARWRFEKIRLATLRARFENPTPGWGGDDFEPWRASAHATFTGHILRRDDGAYFDWLAPFLDIETVRRSESSWLRFWLYDANSRQVPRCWLRWAFEQLQALRKVSDGTPCDAQLGTYLMSCDHFVSADQIMISIADKVRQGSPVPMARNWCVPARNTSEALGKTFADFRMAV